MGLKQGHYKVGNREKYKGDADNVMYRSSWEFSTFKWLDFNENVVNWSSEEISIAYVSSIDGRFHRYFPDIKVKFKDGQTYLVEIKPNAERMEPKPTGRMSKRYITEALTFIKNSDKWKAAKVYAEKRGWQWMIWDEFALRRLGIPVVSNFKK